MRVMVLVKATADSEAGVMPSTEMFEAMGAFNEELAAAGILVSGEGLHPSARGKRIAFDGPARTVIDGPFAVTSELVAGFWLWEVKDLDEAVEWGKRCPNPMPSPSEIEIRPLFEAADFGETFTPELAEREEQLREQLRSGEEPIGRGSDVIDPGSTRAEASPRPDREGSLRPDQVRPSQVRCGSA